MTPSEREQKQVDALLASYSEKKKEISRRSSLCWTAVAGYFLFLYYAGTAVGDGKHKLAWPMGVWMLSALTYFFVFSQYRVISALSAHIKSIIEDRLLVLAGPGPLLGEGAEQYNPAWFPAWLLHVLVFLVIPILTAIFSAYQGGNCLWLLVTSGAGAVIVTSLLLGLRMPPL